ncbi:Methyltransferase-like,S-adenosyl-L-methionine-dependent methyltransferase [Cinara cedri]|uniref:tRNA N(3)-methylcytidine methyltransferase n=1 Tax=Cinara cedri TaxID=506608 RepID=A0A5E4N1E2_9HEMI|nr:Methyltransferase-like,S-adenosyl-L-methionine-dependent methyltransferase [Cinara cedri]
MADDTDKKKQFGNRFLKNENDVFKHNAWDNVEWDETQENNALLQVCEHIKTKMPSEKAVDLENNADQYWDKFYTIHQEKFFKNRCWLFTEFPEITSLQNDKSNSILEVGCGVGNSVFPILSHSASNNIHIYCCDFSSNAINILKENSEYNEEHCTAFVCDITSDDWNSPFALESLDVILLVFVLSAIQPEKLKHVVRKFYEYLKPGGIILFRDYGRYDMAQLRFKEGRCISDNYYSRGDGTLVYFFTQDEVKQLFINSGFEEVQNLVDRRMQVNRGKQLKMYRVWIQCKYRKPTL